MHSTAHCSINTLRIIDSFLQKISYSIALIGGFIILLISFMVVFSIIGRNFFSGSISGDYEIVEIGLGISIFFFLPECYLRKGHVIVDIFTTNCRDRTIKFLDTFSDFIFLFAGVLFSWRIFVSGMESYSYMDQTLLLGIPLWWTFAAGVLSMSLLACCALNRIIIILRGVK